MPVFDFETDVDKAGLSLLVENSDSPFEEQAPITDSNQSHGIVCRRNLNHLPTDVRTRIDHVQVTLSSRYRSLPADLERFPSLQTIHVSAGGFCERLYRQPFPDKVSRLKIAGSGVHRIDTDIVNNNVKLLQVVDPETFLIFATNPFPNLKGLEVWLPKKSRDRRVAVEICESFGSWPSLEALQINQLLWPESIFPKKTTLRRLGLSKSQVECTSFLSNVFGLRYLKINSFKKLRSLEGIEHLVDLREIVLISCNAIEDFSALLALKNIKRVSLPPAAPQSLRDDLLGRDIEVR